MLCQQVSDEPCKSVAKDVPADVNVSKMKKVNSDNKKGNGRKKENRETEKRKTQNDQ